MKNKSFSSIKLFLGVIAGSKDLPATTDEREKAGHCCTLYMRCVSYLEAAASSMLIIYATEVVVVEVVEVVEVVVVEVVEVVEVVGGTVVLVVVVGGIVDVVVV